MSLWSRVGLAVERPLLFIARAPVRIALLVGTVAFFTGGILFSLVERGVSLIDGWYWATVVMPTVGFGDFAPKTIAGRWVYIYVVASGWVTTIILGAALAGAATAARLAHHEATPELDDDLDDLAQTVADKVNRLKAITNHPAVKAALRDIHNEEGAPKP